MEGYLSVVVFDVDGHLAIIKQEPVGTHLLSQNLTFAFSSIFCLIRIWLHIDKGTFGFVSNRFGRLYAGTIHEKSLPTGQCHFKSISAALSSKYISATIIDSGRFVSS